MLPWDEWGRMDQGYQGTAGIDYDELLDVAASVCLADYTEAIVGLYAEPNLRVPRIWSVDAGRPARPSPTS